MVKSKVINKVIEKIVKPKKSKLTESDKVVTKISAEVQTIK